MHFVALRKQCWRTYQPSKTAKLLGDKNINEPYTFFGKFRVIKLKRIPSGNHSVYTNFKWDSGLWIQGQNMERRKIQGVCLRMLPHSYWTKPKLPPDRIVSTFVDWLFEKSKFQSLASLCMSMLFNFKSFQSVRFLM